MAFYYCQGYGYQKFGSLWTNALVLGQRTGRSEDDLRKEMAIGWQWSGMASIRESMLMLY